MVIKQSKNQKFANIKNFKAMITLLNVIKYKITFD